MARIRAQATAIASAAAVCLTVAACTGGGPVTSAPTTSSSGTQAAQSARASAGSGTGTEQARTASAPCTSSSALIVGVKVDQYGTGWLDVRTYTNEGFDIDVANHISQTVFHLQDPDFLPVSSATRAPALASCAIRYFVATYTILPSRQRQFAIAGPYLVTYQGVMLGPDSPDITKPNQLVGKRVCVVGGGSQAQNVLDQFVPGAIAVPEGAYSTCLTQLRLGNVDAFSTDLAILYGYLNEPGLTGFRIVKGLVIGDPIYYGIAFRKSDQKLCQETAQVLENWTQSAEWAGDLQETLGNYVADQALYPEGLQPTYQEIAANSCVNPPPAGLFGPIARSSVDTS